MTPNPNPSPELLPCPLCQSPAISGGTLDDGHYVSCMRDKCKCIVGDFDTPSEAIAAWNTRALSPQTLPAPGEVEGKVLARVLTSWGHAHDARAALRGAYDETEAMRQIVALATVAAANDEGVAELRDLEANATRGEWSVAEGSVEDGSIYIDADDTGDRPVAMIMSGSPHNQDRADAAFIVAAVAFARAAIRLLSQRGGKA